MKKILSLIVAVAMMATLAIGASAFDIEELAEMEPDEIMAYIDGLDEDELAELLEQIIAELAELDPDVAAAMQEMIDAFEALGDLLGEESDDPAETDAATEAATGSTGTAAVSGDVKDGVKLATGAEGVLIFGGVAVLALGAIAIVRKRK